MNSLHRFISLCASLICIVRASRVDLMIYCSGKFASRTRRTVLLVRRGTCVTLLLLQYPVYPLLPFHPLPPPFLGPSIFLPSRCSRFLPFSPSRTCVRARAPSDFFPVFTHRSFFPFRNIIGGTMHLSPSPSPPSGAPLPSTHRLGHRLSRRGEDRSRTRSLVRFRRASAGLGRMHSDACRQLANSRLPQTGSANRPISRA